MASMQMLDYNRPLEMKQLPVPDVHGEEVLVKIQGSGLCHSDLHLMDGSIKIIPNFPFTLGHENAGTVEEVGERVSGFKKGDPVVVYGGWSRKSDRFSMTGQEQLTDTRDWVGIGQPGGYAEYLKVPTFRYLLRGEGLDPVESAILTDAGLTPYRAIKKLQPSLYPGSTIVIIGCGGLGQFGVQYSKLLTPSARTIAIDLDDKKLAIAKGLGADITINSKKEDAVAKVKELTDDEGAQGMVDFVGADTTLTQAYSMGGRQSKLVVVGLAGGTLKYTAGLLNEMEVTTSSWGSISELDEVLSLAKMGKIHTRAKKIGFGEMNKTFEELAAGKIEGRAILVPDQR
jgi:propanol-preferring alcohol dehydrogenase